MIQGDSTRGDVADDGRTTEFREQLRAILESAASRHPDELAVSDPTGSRAESGKRASFAGAPPRGGKSARLYQSSDFRENRAVARILAQLEVSMACRPSTIAPCDSRPTAASQLIVREPPRGIVASK